MLDPRYLRYMSLAAHATLVEESKPAPKTPEPDETAVYAKLVREDRPAA